MKTPEEIEQLAESYLQKNKYNFDNWKEIVHVKQTYIACYTKCQEDMADKKYTLRDIEKAFLEGCASERRFSRRIDELDKYIISLNKQD